MLYSEKVMDHFTHPRNLGKMEDADGVGEVGNAKCGDIMKIYIKVENDIITDVKFHCSVLAEEAVRAAVKDYYDRNGIAYDKEKFAEHCAACHEGHCHCD